MGGQSKGLIYPESLSFQVRDATVETVFAEPESYEILVEPVEGQV